MLDIIFAWEMGGALDMERWSVIVWDISVGVWSIFEHGFEPIT